MERLRMLLSPQLWTERGASLLAAVLAAAAILIVGRIAAKVAANMVRRVLDVQIFSTVLLDEKGVKVIVPNGAITAGTIRVHAEAATDAAAEPPQARAG
jgi:transcriptional regulator CtsR